MTGTFRPATAAAAVQGLPQVFDRAAAEGYARQYARGELMKSIRVGRHNAAAKEGRQLVRGYDGPGFADAKLPPLPLPS